MFDRYNDQARRVIILAQEEARALNHHYIGTEHLLLALTRDGNAASGPVLATRVLASLNVRHDNVRQLVLGGGQGATNFSTGTFRSRRMPSGRSNSPGMKPSSSAATTSAPNTSCWPWPARTKASPPTC